MDFNIQNITMGCLCAAIAGSLLSPGLMSCQNANASELEIVSPDGQLTAHIGVNPQGRLFYLLNTPEQAVVDTSYLSLSTRHGSIGRNCRITDTKRSSTDETWQTVWGQEASIRNQYNELAVELAEEGSALSQFSIVVRIFNDGLGFRYEIPQQNNIDSIVITDEDTQFNIPEDGTAWSQPWNHEYYEHLYIPGPVSKIDTVTTPLTMKLTDTLYLSLHEANLVDYAEMDLYPEAGTTRLHSFLVPWSTGEKVFAALPMKTPWRTVTVAKNPAGLALSRITLNLADPCAIKETSWIDPGRYVGIWWGMHMDDFTWHSGPKHGATTANAKRYIDFAAANGYKGVLVEGWNQTWDGDWTKNANIFSFTQAYPDFDLSDVASYAREKGVRLIGHNETAGGARNYESQLDSAFSLYNRLGINTVKTGYVSRLLDGKELHGSQYGVRHYRKVAETAARHNIMIVNHEGVMSTGWERTYPNFMAQENMRGQEYDAWSPDGGNPPEHTCTLPFTRGLAGPMDFTPGTFNFDNKSHPGTRPQTTIAKQLALAVVIYSPVVMSSDEIENYQQRPEFEFLRRCPTDWEKTLYPEAAIGEYVTVARKCRGGDDWYIGAITNANPHNSDVKLDFLDTNTTYTAKVFADGPKADYRTDPYPVEITSRTVKAGDNMRLSLAPGGGAAVIFTKNTTPPQASNIAQTIAK